MATSGYISWPKPGTSSWPRTQAIVGVNLRRSRQSHNLSQDVLPTPTAQAQDLNQKDNGGDINGGNENLTLDPFTISVLGPLSSDWLALATLQGSSNFLRVPQ
jgi:hypothetical protein